jgi:hypothetical protein
LKHSGYGKIGLPIQAQRAPLTESCLAAIAPAALALMSRAMIWYVSSKDGSDANDGRSASKAFATFAHAAGAAKAGDTITIVPGAYAQDLAAQVSAARTASITVVVAGGH